MIHEGSWSSISRARLGPDSQQRRDRRFAQSHRATRTRNGSPAALAVAGFLYCLAGIGCLLTAASLHNAASFLFVLMGAFFAFSVWTIFEEGA